jgi:ATP-dependent DNA helicase RecG
MKKEEFEVLIEELRALPQESEWVEFKVNNSKPDEIGEYISALSNSACLENKEFGYLVYGIEDKTHKIEGNNKLKTVKELTGTKGYALDFEFIVNYVNDKLPSNEDIGRVFRKEVRVYPELAVRELLANAIIHQDFSISGTSTMIEIFDNRIEITNPGKPLIDTKRFIDHSPESRNEMLAGFMRRMNFCEERGSGIDKVIDAIEIFQLPAPEFIEGDNYTRVVMFSPKSLRQMSKPDKVRACYQHCCLKYVSGDYMSNQSLRERFDVDKKNYSIISRIIRETFEAGLIKEYEKSRMYVPFWAG